MLTNINSIKNDNYLLDELNGLDVFVKKKK